MTTNPNLISEDQIPTNWQPADFHAAIPAAPAPAQPDIPQYFSGSMPPTLQHDATFVGTEIGTPRIPKSPLMPLGLQANPQTNAAVSSTSKIIIQSTPVVGGVTSVGLSMPKEFVVTNSPITSAGTLGAAWVAESAGTYLGVPNASTAPSIDASSSNSANDTTVTTSIQTGPQQDLVLYYTSADGTHPTGTVSSPTGGTWTTLPSLAPGLTSGGWYQLFPAGSVISQTETYNTSNPSFKSISNALIAIPASGTPAIALSGSGGGAFSVISLTTTVVAGQSLMLFVTITDLAAGVPTYIASVSDSVGNVWYKIRETLEPLNSGGTNYGSGISIWFCPKPAAGSYNVLVSTNGPTLSGSVFIHTITNLAASQNAIPQFRYFNAADLTGVVPVSEGGLGTSLVGTGGANRFLAQTTGGGIITVIQPDFNNLAGAAGKTPAAYNGSTLAANGLASVFGQANLPSVVTNTAPTSVYFPTANTAGLHRVTVYIIVVQAATTSSTLPDSQIIYTDQDTGLVTTIAATPSSNGNTTSTFLTASIVINAKSGTAIQYAIGQVTPYASSGTTVMRYTYRMRIECLG